MRSVAWLVAVVLGGGGLVGCGGGGGGAGDAAGALRGLLAAAKDGDAAKAASFFPTPELLAQYVECPPGEDALAGVAKVRASIAAELPELAGLELVAFQADKTETQAIAAGADVRGCKAKLPFEMKKERAILKKADGDTESETVRFFVFDGRYYLIKL